MPEATDVRDFLLADLGEGLEEGTVLEWRVAVGDVVELNQVLCLVETEKAEVEVPAPWAGTVTALGGDEGATIQVGQPLVSIEVGGEGGDEAQEPAASRQSTLVGTGPDESSDRSRRARRHTTRRTPTASRPLAKPPVRMLARRLGVDLTTVTGSGPDGVVTRSDVEAAAGEDTPAREATPAASGQEHTVVPVTGVRARIAERMTASHTTIPTATASVLVDCTRLLEVRAQLVDHAERRGHDRAITPFALICRFLIQQLGSVPMLNSSFDEAGPEIRVHNGVHLGIGTATERGLVVTVVRDAQTRPLHDLAGEMARLAEGARAGTLSPREMSGSTFTVSNFGALGIDDGVPIVNPPEAGILGVGAIRRRPHVVGDEIEVRSTATLTLVFDHRVADGAEAGRLLGGLRELIEAPELALFGA